MQTALASSLASAPYAPTPPNTPVSLVEIRPVSGQKITVADGHELRLDMPGSLVQTVLPSPPMDAMATP